MSDFTPRANLRLPGGGSTGTILPDEQVDIDVLNDNFRKIDALLGARTVPSASSYSGSMDGDLVYARDTKLLSIYDANSTGLVSPRVEGGTRFKGTQAQMAAFTGAEDGDSFFNTTNNSEYVRLGGTWQLASLLLSKNVSVTSTNVAASPVTAPGVSLSFSLSTSLSFIALVRVQTYSNFLGDVVTMDLKDGGTTLLGWSFPANSSPTTAGTSIVFTGAGPVELSAGSHSLTLSLVRAAGSGTINLFSGATQPFMISLQR